MKSVLVTVRDTVRTQLWPIPVLAVLAAVVGGVLLPRLDGRVDGHVPGWLRDIIFGGDAGAASTLLDAISSSLITVTSLTFSLTVVTLQLASGQFSPRLLRTFTSDVFVQATLALFLATFTYALTTLRAVRSADDGSGGFVPRISVTLAFVLAVLSVIGLVLFLAHLARQIRVETMLREVHRDASATVTAVTESAGSLRDRAFPEPSTGAATVFGRHSGFVTSLDEAALLRTATSFGCHIRVDVCAGSSVVVGRPVATVWATNRAFGADERRCLLDDIGDAVRVGYERTAAQDVGYGLRQLTDVANKALSPGINDPTTAVHAIGHLSSLLCQLAHRELGSTVLRGDDGEPRVRLARPTFADLLDDSVTQPRRYGAGDPFVLRRLFGLFEDLGWQQLDEHATAAVQAQLARLRDTVIASDLDDTERAYLEQAQRRAERALGHNDELTAP